MPFDPTLPQEHTEMDAAQMRGQLTGLKDISDALAATNITAVVVDAVATLDAGQPATVEVSVDGHTLHLTLGLPRGADGAPGGTGSSGADGGPGPQGPQGPPGEVTTADLAGAITGTSANTNGVATLGLSASGSYDASDLQNVISKLNELITAMRR
jgi:hypothetical protein